MENFAVPLVAATVFTAGGYAITRAEKHAEAIGDWLFTLMVMTVFVGCAILANQALERRRPAMRADNGVAVRNLAVLPPGQVWAEANLPAY